MVFSSLIFLLVFLPMHLAAYHIASERAKNLVLLVSSLIFYAWGGPAYVLLLAGDTLIAWAAALLIDRAGSARAKTVILACGAGAVLALLGYFKYAGFIAGIVQAITSWPPELPDIFLPIGISFYSFQLISYMADVRRGEVAPQGAYWKLLLYSSLFHQCIAGPIVRYETVAEQLESRSPKGSDRYLGIRRFAVGLAKKTLLANACAEVADGLLPIGAPELAAQSTAGLWLGMAFYMLQIYLDFSAYSDMAIGLGRMVGLRYLENFDHPYESSSVREFWQRWHISLGTFFRDYVYIPLGGSRCETPVYVRNMCVVWLLTGLWHGASWNYLFWGAWFLGWLLLEHFVIRDRLPKPLAHVYLLLVVYLGWVLFKFEDAGELMAVAGGMVGLTGVPLGSMTASSTFMSNIFLLAASIVACTGLGSRLARRVRQMAPDNGVALAIASAADLLIPPVCLLLSIAAMAGASYNPFIYFQF